MATTHEQIGREFQQSEGVAARRLFTFNARTHEAQTVTVSKGGGALTSSATTATQVSGVIYKLAIASGDLSTVGDLLFQSAGTTDTKVLMGLRVVEHDPFSAVADILSDTGTDGVVLTGAANSGVANAVWSEDITDHKAVADSAAEALHWTRQATGWGVVEADAGANTIKVKDGSGTIIKTITGATVGDVTTWTPA